MASRIESHSIAGTLTGFVGVVLPFVTLTLGGRVTRFDLRVSDAPAAGGSVVVELVNAASGAAITQATLTAGARHVSITAAADVGQGVTLGLRVVSESGGAIGLSASVELDETPPTALNAFLTSLPRVKDSLNITGLTADGVLAAQIAGVSAGMQNWMGVQILQASWLAEPHFATGLSSALVLDHGPILSVEEIRQDGTVLAASTYRIERGRTVRRVSGALARQWSLSELSVDYTSGYVAVPADLVEAATQETARRWLQTVRGGGDGAHVTATTPETGDTKTLSPDGYLPQTIEVMRQYRRIV